MLLTIFTPTYNRLETIDRLYKSLMNQTTHSFEWIIIDDGSNDNTEYYFEKIRKFKSDFLIKYIKVPNGGKHRAINKGIDIASGEFFFIVDSDDWLPPKSIENVLSWLNTIKKKKDKFVGVSGLKGYDTESMVGKTFLGEYVDCTALNRQKYNIYGDKSEVFRTSVLREYKFPEIDGENFMTESVVWNRMAADGYYIRYFNEINYICDYLDDGLTKNIDTVYLKNFKGYCLYVKEFLLYENSVIQKVRMKMAYGYRGRINKIPYSKLAVNIGISTFEIFILSNIGIFYKKITSGKKR